MLQVCCSLELSGNFPFSCSNCAAHKTIVRSSVIANGFPRVNNSHLFVRNLQRFMKFVISGTKARGQ